MAFETVGDLRTQILSFLARTPDDEDTVVDQVNTFIALAEQRIGDDLRVREMQERVASPMDEATESLPAYFAEALSCSLQETTGGWRPLKFVAEDEYNSTWRYEGNPRVYTITGGQLRFGPYILYDEAVTDRPNVELTFFARPRPLTDANPTNEILKYYPSLYLYGSLVEAGMFISSDQAELYGQMFDKGVAAANERSSGAMYEAPSRSTPGVQVA